MNFIFLGCFPQGEIARVIFNFIDIYSSTGEQFIEIFIGKLSVISKIFHAIINITVAGSVCEAFIDQLLDHGDNFVDISGCPRLNIRSQYSQARLIFTHVLNETPGQIAICFTVVISTFDNLVIDVSDISNVSYIPPLTTQKAGDHVEPNHDAGMTNVAIIVDRDATNIHGNLARRQWLEKLFLSGQGVINVKRHSYSVIPESERLVFVIHFCPAVTQSNSAIEDRAFRAVIFAIETKITFALKLKMIVQSCTGQAHFRLTIAQNLQAIWVDAIKEILTACIRSLIGKQTIV